MFKILVADDEPVMLGMVERLLSKEGHEVIKTTSAQGVREIISAVTPDLFLIDVNLPDYNGLLLCQELRETPDFIETPIVFLTATAADPDYVAEALNSGADDFIQKPFAARELAARIRAQLRRVRIRQESSLPVIRLDMDANLVRVDNREAELTRVEFNLLAHMCQQPNTWQTTRDLLADVWRYPGNIGDAALVRNHIRNIRRKIEPNPDHPTIILSRHRRGYLIAAQVDMIGEAPPSA
jgi:DNA-binding response OmpR family regulator